MADYFGHFLKGIGSGIQTGLQIAEMRWQKKERERIQKEKEEIMGAASAFNKKLEEFYADKELSKDERQQLDTIYMTSGYNVQELIKGSYDAVVKLDKETVENNLALLKSYRDDWGDFDFDLRTIPELAEYYRGRTIGEKSKQIFDAGDRLLQKRYEAKQEVVPEISVTERKYNWAIENFKADKITFDELSKYMGAYIAPEEKSAKEQEIELMKQYGATNEQIKNKLLGISVGLEPTPAPTSTENVRGAISDADTPEDARRIYKNYADKYDETALGIDDVDKFWAEGQTVYLNNIKTAIGNIIDEKGWLKKGTLTSVEVGIDFKGEQSVEEIYKKLKEEYTRYRDMLEKMGIDISQFPELRPLEEIEKVGFGEGFWGFGVQRGQYKSIYK